MGGGGGRRDTVADLPSVSVCISALQAARSNQTERLSLCIEHILASTYPKLEVIVLHELQILEQLENVTHYARNGVRFVQSDSVDETLSDTESREDLLRQASGSLVCFIDVDTQLEPESLGQLVSQFIAQSAAAWSQTTNHGSGDSKIQSSY